MTHITETKDVAELVVLQSVDVDVEPAGLMGQLTAANELRGGLRRNDVKHVKVLANR